MQYFKLKGAPKKLSFQSLRVLQLKAEADKRIASFSLTKDQAKHYYHIDNNLGLRAKIEEEMKKQKLTDLSLKKESVSYKYRKVQKGSFWVRIGALISAPFLGVNLAVIAMTLSLVIQLFHKMILFNTTFGPYLNYFLVASSSVLENSEDEDPSKLKFNPIQVNKRLVEEAELNTYTTSEYPVELMFLFGFFLLRMVRYLLRTFVFARWEEKHGADIYRMKK